MTDFLIGKFLLDKAGWGDWAGPGMTGVSTKIVQKRQRLLRNLDEKKAELKLGRKDSILANVIVSEKRIKTTGKYKLAEVPHPFTSREEYERSIQMPVGSKLSFFILLYLYSTIAFN